jgi:hypothetical protein
VVFVAHKGMSVQIFNYRFAVFFPLCGSDRTEDESLPSPYSIAFLPEDGRVGNKCTWQHPVQTSVLVALSTT